MPKRENKALIGQYKYGQRVEKQIARGKSMEAAHKIATSPLMKKADKFAKPSWGDKLILGILRRGKKKKGKKSLTTARTADITSRLKKAGIDQKTINKMRSKKKSN